MDTIQAAKIDISAESDYDFTASDMSAVYKVALSFVPSELAQMNPTIFKEMFLDCMSCFLEADLTVVTWANDRCAFALETTAIPSAHIESLRTLLEYRNDAEVNRVDIKPRLLETEGGMYHEVISWCDQIYLENVYVAGG